MFTVLNTELVEKLSAVNCMKSTHLLRTTDLSRLNSVKLQYFLHVKTTNLKVVELLVLQLEVEYLC